VNRTNEVTTTSETVTGGAAEDVAVADMTNEEVDVGAEETADVGAEETVDVVAEETVDVVAEEVVAGKVVADEVVVEGAAVVST
jgi:hypothetical protein